MGWISSVQNLTQSPAFTNKLQPSSTIPRILGNPRRRIDPLNPIGAIAVVLAHLRYEPQPTAIESVRVVYEIADLHLIFHIASATVSQMNNEQKLRRCEETA